MVSKNALENIRGKCRILCLRDLFVEETDENHGLTRKEISEKLLKHNLLNKDNSENEDSVIERYRRTFRKDLDAIEASSFEIHYDKNKHKYYYSDRAFSKEDLTFVVDAIYSCRAITKKKTESLIETIKHLVSEHQREDLESNVHVRNHIKAQNDNVFTGVSIINKAIKEGHKVKFYYAKLGRDKKLHRRQKNGEDKHYEVTPICIVYDDGFYYLKAWDANSKSGNQDRTYRLDRMEEIEQGETVPNNEEIAHGFPPKETCRSFGQYGDKGTETAVGLLVQEDKLEIITDLFGQDTTEFEPLDNDSELLKCTVNVYKSKQFFGWIASLGKDVVIDDNDPLFEEYQGYLSFLLSNETSGRNVRATLSVQASKTEIIAGRYGDNKEIKEYDGDRLHIEVQTRANPEFFGWVASMNRAIRIEAPPELVKDYHDYLKSLMNEP